MAKQLSIACPECGGIVVFASPVGIQKLTLQSHQRATADVKCFDCDLELIATYSLKPKKLEKRLDTSHKL